MSPSKAPPYSYWGGGWKLEVAGRKTTPRSAWLRWAAFANAADSRDSCGDASWKRGSSRLRALTEGMEPKGRAPVEGSHGAWAARITASADRAMGPQLPGSGASNRPSALRRRPGT